MISSLIYRDMQGVHLQIFATWLRLNGCDIWDIVLRWVGWVERL